MMYTSTLDWAWSQNGLKGKEKMVLLFLAYEAGKATFITVHDPTAGGLADGR